MSPAETLSLTLLALGVGSVLRFVWLDSLRFADVNGHAADPAALSPRTVQRLAEAAHHTQDFTETDLPRAA